MSDDPNKKLPDPFGYRKTGPFLWKFAEGCTLDGPHSQLKLCIVSTDMEFLRDLLSELIKDPDSYYVKYKDDPKDGMWLGRAFYKTDKKACQMWAQLKAHPKCLVSLQNDEITKPIRDQVKSWKGLNPLDL